VYRRKSWDCFRIVNKTLRVASSLSLPAPDRTLHNGTNSLLVLTFTNNYIAVIVYEYSLKTTE